jgi:hypothetical protein
MKNSEKYNNAVVAIAKELSKYRTDYTNVVYDAKYIVKLLSLYGQVEGIDNVWKRMKLGKHITRNIYL